ncbi:Sau1hsdS1 [[Clostridium] sordellii]|uniref:Sau1hsdS1 n=1 Tax=Paraclostridium sordellii TaxID=1505 RepID=A0A0C7R4A0_PARSO|nr:restriction endonuclease subunit S [Paeniclostridium sordellii]CEQ02989.1 Sau1hsdS1 [[Clostridium] sordellii] [Paeniclostridium sordellii]
MNKTPKLRFKEFSGNWEKAILGDRAYIKGRIGWKNLKQEEYTKKGPYLIAGKHIKNGIIDWDKCDHISIDRYNESPEIALKDDDIIFSKDGSLGNPAIIEDLKSEATINGTMMLVRLDNTFIYPKYFYYILNSRYFEKLINELKSGSSIPHIFQRDIVSFKFPITEIKEQEKIASFFSLIDDKISLQGEKIEAFKDYKKGMMQKIFSRELRFKDDEGRDYPEWEEKKLKSIVSKKKKGKNAIYAESGNILLNNEYMENNTEPLYVENEIDVNVEDILILWDGSQAGKMYTGFTGVLGSTFIAITLDKHNCNRFIYQQLIYNLDKIQIAWREGSGVPHVAKDFIENFKVKVPALEEQIKIYKMLDGIDIKLKKEQEKLDSLNEYKKGLLQQIFV